MDISIYRLMLAALLLIFPLLIFSNLKLKLSGQLFNSFARMIVQLAIIGLILQFIFNRENPWLAFLWMLIMLANAVLTLKGRLKFQKKILLPVLIFSLLTTTLIVMPWLIIVVLRPEPLFAPRFLIPIYGMILGNSMNNCSLALERFESGLSENWILHPPFFGCKPMGSYPSCFQKSNAGSSNAGIAYDCFYGTGNFAWNDDRSNFRRCLTSGSY